MGQYARSGKLQAYSLATLLLATSALLSPLPAQELDGNALEKLALQGTWEAEHAEYGFWNLSDDRTVCLRVGSRNGKCADTGTWNIADNVLCYEFTWWGETVGERKGCFTVQPIGDGRFETLFHGGPMVSRMFAFKVVK
jgi:hypothetical protein